MAEPLGQVLAAVHLAVGVERFVVVGGFALALGYEYLRALADAARSSCWDRGAEWPKMLELGSDEEEAGLIGAGAFAARETESARAPAEEGAAGNETPPE
jgi:glucokinase